MNSSAQSSVHSLDSLESHSSPDFRPKPKKETHETDTSSLHPSLSHRILTRTSTIIDGIRDDNNYVSKTESKRIQPAPFGETAPEDNADDSDLLVNYNGDFNKQDILDRPPDGTFWGWTSAVCCCVMNAFSWGSNACFGVFLNYYVTTNHFPGATMEDFTVVGGLGLGLSFMLCNLANALVRRFYYKYVMAVGIVIIVVCYMAAAEVKTVVQLIMLQGFLMAIGFALAAGPCFAITPSWFLEKRSIANGITTAGGGLGGLIFSRPIQALIDSTGDYKWALRMLGIVCGVMLTVGCLLIRCRRSMIVKSDNSTAKELLKGFTRWDIYRQRPILLLAVWNFVYGIGYTIMLFSMSSYATAIGLTYQQGSLVTTLQSLAQTIGRPILGITCDRFGRTNVTIFFTGLMTILTTAFWIFVKSYASLIVFAMLTGFMVGINWVSFTPLCADVVGGGDDLLAAVSFLCLTGGPPMVVAEMVGLKLQRPQLNQPYIYCQILVGVSCLISTLILFPFREWKIHRMLAARRDLLEKKPSSELSEEDRMALERYNVLLRSDPKGYVMRMLYPIKA